MLKYVVVFMLGMMVGGGAVLHSQNGGVSTGPTAGVVKTLTETIQNAVNPQASVPALPALPDFGPPGAGREESSKAPSMHLISGARNASRDERIDSSAEFQRLMQERDNKAADRRLMEQAWEQHYNEPDECLGYSSQAAMVACVNERIRERREFEQRWLQGQR